MLVIRGEIIYDLNKTEVDFLNRAREVYIDKKTGVWFSLMEYPYIVWVQALGDGSFNLYRVPMDFDFDFEEAKNYKEIAHDYWDTRWYMSFNDKVNELLRKE